MIERIFSHSGNEPVSSQSHERGSQTSNQVFATGIRERLRQRERELYGEKLIDQQRMHERWLIKESWYLKTEALPLLAGYDPDHVPAMENGRDGNDELNDLWNHAQRCVEQGLLQVINRDDDPENWRIQPFDAFRWAALSRIRIPESLAALLDFINKTVRKPGAENISTGTGHPSPAGDDDKVRVLGAALAILAADPGRCLDGNGQISADRIAQIIVEKGDFWFGDQPVNLPDPAIRALIDRWLNTVPRKTGSMSHRDLGILHHR